VTVVPVMVLKRRDATENEIVGPLDEAALIYFTGGNPRRTVKVLEESLAWQKTIDAWSRGAVLAGSSAGAMIMCEKMLVPRWKVPVDGLNLLPGTMVVPHHDAWIKRIHRVTKSGVARGLNLYGVDECTGFILDDDSAHILGASAVTLYRDGEVVWSREAPWEGMLT
jgi:cyanophycinase